MVQIELLPPENPMRTTSNPRIIIPVSPLERILDAAGAAFVLATFLLPAFTYRSLPSVIPRHFGITGKPDAWGGPNLLFILPVVSLVLYASLTVMRRYPRLFNYPVRITEENAGRQYRLARKLISVLKTVITALFAWIEYRTIQTALGKSEGLGMVFLPVCLALIIGAIAVYFVEAFRSR